MRPLLVLHRDPAFRERVGRLRTRRSVRFAESWAELTGLARVSVAGAVALVDPYLGSERPAEPAVELAELLRSFPALRVLAVVPPAMHRFSVLRALILCGVDDVVTTVEEVGELAGRRDGDDGRWVERVLGNRSLNGLTSRQLQLLQAAATVASSGGQGEEMAHLLHVSMRTLLRRCQALGLPAPRQLLAWMRVLRAAELLTDGGRSVEDVALATGYSSGSALSRVVRDLVGLTPKELARAGALPVVLSRFREALGSGEVRRVAG